MRYVLVGDGESPHLLKWARALAAHPEIELWAASSRGFAPGFEALLPPARRLALATSPKAAGGNFGLLRELPRFTRWLNSIDADWLHAHYLSSHGTLAWLAKRCFGIRAPLVGSAWGSDILVAPARSAAMRWVTRRVLRACVLTTSDSEVMAQRMRELGAWEVMVFPFGLEAMPAAPGDKLPWQFFANRGLEPIYDPGRVLRAFAAVAAWQPEARLAVANDGSLRATMQADAQALGLADRVQFLGRLDAEAQARHYARATWFLSLPQSDSVSVSVLEAMAQGCIPLLSDLPANRELVRDSDNGMLLPAGALPSRAALESLLAHAPALADANRAWVQRHALFGPSVARYLQRLAELRPARSAP